MRHCLGIVLAMSITVSGCAHAPLATATASAQVGNVTGVTIGSVQAPVPVVTTIIRTCAPPAAFLADPGPLAKLTESDTPLARATSYWLADRAAYRSLRVTHNALSKWVRAWCQK